MDWSILARWEWLVIEFAVLALAIFELVSVRRSLRRDREVKAVRESVHGSLRQAQDRLAHHERIETKLH